MIFRSLAIRISFALVLLTANLLVVANGIGLIPDVSQSALELRKGFAESLAVQFSIAAEKGEVQTIQRTLRAVVERNEELRSAAVRSYDGNLIALAGEHLAQWKAPPGGKSTPTHIQVPVFRKHEKYAVVEIRFRPLWEGYLQKGFASSLVGLIAFVALSSFVFYSFILKRTLRELDPSSLIPDRVQKAFDVLQEGVLILDENEQIVMANKALASLVGKVPEALMRKKGSELGWLEYKTPKQVRQLPWIKVVKDGLDQMGASLSLMNNVGGKVKLAVNAGKITDNAGKCRGTLVTFGDITQLEEKNWELSDLVQKLQLAQGEIQAKSRELEFLANRDPLTLCVNRRALDRSLNECFTKAKTEGTPLSCLMADIDFFKSVNDRYGHATGDQVIRAVADVLKRSTRDADIVGRYGGEEFCVVLPGLKLGVAAQIAERIRQAIEKDLCAGVKITVSLGAASLESNASKPNELINQADKALYAAKKGGRNQVVTWAKDVKLVVGDDGVKSPGQISKAGKEVKTTREQLELQRRIHELEGLLEKRTIELEHSATYDLKTGLPTSSLFKDRIEHAIARAMRGNFLAAVLSMRSDTVKQVQETIGHRAAEQLLKAWAHRMNDLLREHIDTVSAIETLKASSSLSMISQTELGILLAEIKQVDNVTWVMKRLMDTLEKPFQIQGSEIYLSAHIGVAIFPHDGLVVEELVRNASNACSHSQKVKGKDRYLFSSQHLNETAAEQLQIENLLHGAIENKELELHYQPKIEVATGRIAGFEALLRWKSASLGFVPPGKFIPIAEHFGLIEGLGDWVLYDACRQLRTWLDMGLEVGSVAVNISGVQLRQRGLANGIRSVLDEFNLDAGLLELELTESSMVNTYEKALSVLKQIKEMGIRLTMDDFGTGYSSLACLRNIPLSCMKIDRAFVSEINKDENANRLIASIVSIGHGLGLEIVAEGIEEKHQADYLAALGCEYFQGYYFGRPIPHNEVVELLHNQGMALIGWQINFNGDGKQCFREL